MKIKGPWIRRSGRWTLRIRPQGPERFEYSQAEWLRTCEDPYLLPFSYKGDASGKVVLSYDVTDYAPLKSRLKEPLSGDDYLYLLTDLVEVLLVCSRKGYRSSSLIFDPEHVYVDSEGTPVFVFVPLSGVPFGVDNTPLTYLRRLGDAKRLRLLTADDVLHAEHLADYVRREEAFSINTFEAFIEREFGVAFEADGSLRYVAGPQSQFVLSTGSAVTSDQYGGYAGYGGAGAGSASVTASDAGGQTYAHDTCRRVLVRLGTGERFVLAEGMNDVGKGSASDVTLEGNVMISRVHATIACNGGSLAIQDRGSTNGTFVRGGRLAASEAVQLAVGERFRLADEDFVIE